MASTLEIRRRLRSIKSTAKITKAMELVAASKLRKAQESAERSRAFAETLRGITDSISAAGRSIKHPLLKTRPINRALVIVVTSDKGLAGSFNLNILRETVNYLKSAPKEVSFITIGRRGQGSILRLGHKIIGAYTDFPAYPTFIDIAPISKTIIEEYTAERIDQVVLISTRFQSAISQMAEKRRLLPLALTAAEKDKAGLPLFEPEESGVLDALLPKIIEEQLYQAVLESSASEHAARMVAMRNATDAAKEIIDDLTLTYNSIRQATITRELTEIVGGAEAL